MASDEARFRATGSDGGVCECSMRAARCSSTLRDIIEDVGDIDFTTSPIAIPNVTTRVLRAVFEFYEHIATPLDERPSDDDGAAAATLAPGRPWSPMYSAETLAEIADAGAASETLSDYPAVAEHGAAMSRASAVLFAASSRHRRSSGGDGDDDDDDDNDDDPPPAATFSEVYGMPSHCFHYALTPFERRHCEEQDFARDIVHFKHALLAAIYLRCVAHERALTAFMAERVREMSVEEMRRWLAFDTDEYAWRADSEIDDAAPMSTNVYETSERQQRERFEHCLERTSIETQRRCLDRVGDDNDGALTDDGGYDPDAILAFLANPECAPSTPEAPAL